MSNLSKSNAAKPVWQPMAVLKNLDMQNVRFLQDEYSRTKTSQFKEWEPEEVPIEKALAQPQTAEDAAALNDTGQKNNVAPTTLDKALLEKETSAAYAKGLKACSNTHLRAHETKA